jgi:hypothetical protein
MEPATDLRETYEEPASVAQFVKAIRQSRIDKRRRIGCYEGLGSFAITP